MTDGHEPGQIPGYGVADLAVGGRAEGRTIDEFQAPAGAFDV